MDRLVRSLLTAACVLAVPNLASAVPFTITGNATGSDATAEGDVTLMGSELTLEITNTSPFDARITGIGFDLIIGDFTANNSSGLDGFAGNDPGGFTFSDAALGNVPQFSSSVLDFGWITGNNFQGGSPNNGLAPNDTLTFTVSDTFAGLTDTQIADALFVRFQRVGEDGEGSDVGTPGDVPDVVPEPATLLLFGLGLAGAAAVRRRV